MKNSYNFAFETSKELIKEGKKAHKKAKKAIDYAEEARRQEEFCN